MSAKQDKQRKLWQERGQLELAHANMKSAYNIAVKQGLVQHAVRLEDAARSVRELIRYNIKDMGSL